MKRVPPKGPARVLDGVWGATENSSINFCVVLDAAHPLENPKQRLGLRPDGRKRTPVTRVHVAGVTAHPDSGWVTQQARNMCIRRPGLIGVFVSAHASYVATRPSAGVWFD